jgi:hypothetical protein
LGRIALYFRGFYQISSLRFSAKTGIQAAPKCAIFLLHPYGFSLKMRSGVLSFAGRPILVVILFLTNPRCPAC